MSEGTNTDHCPEAHKSFRFLAKKDKAKKKKLNFLLSNVVKELGPGNKNWFENATAKNIQQKKLKLENVDSSLCTPRDKIHSNEQSESCSTSSDNKFYSKIQRLLTSQTSTPTELWQIPVLGASPDVVSGAAPQCKQIDIRKSLGVDLNDSLLSWTSSMATPTLMDSTYKGSPSPVVKPQKGLPRVLFSPGPSQTDEDLIALENTSEDNTDDDEELYSILPARKKSKITGTLISHDVATLQNINQHELFNTDSENLTETDSEEKFSSKSRISSKNCKNPSTENESVGSSVIEEESMPLFSQDLYMEDEIEESQNQDVTRVIQGIKRENISKTTADDSGVSEVLSDFFDPPSSAVGRRRCAPRKGKKRKLLDDSLNFGSCDESMVSYSTPKSAKKKTAWLSIEDRDDQNKSHLQKEGGEIKQEFQITIKSEKVENQSQNDSQREENDRTEEYKITVKSELIEGELHSTTPKICLRNQSLSLSQENVSHEHCSTPNNADKTLKSILSSKKNDGSAVKSNKKVRFSVEEKSSLKRNPTQLEDEECVSPDVFVENLMANDLNTGEKKKDDCHTIPVTISNGNSAQTNLMLGNIRSDKQPKTDSNVEICDELFSQVSPTALNEMCSAVTMVDTDNLTQKPHKGNIKTNIKLPADDNPISVKVENKDTTLPEMKTETVDKVQSHPVKSEGNLPVHEPSNPKPNLLRSSIGLASKPRKFLYPSSNQINKLCPKTVYGFAEQKNLTMDTHTFASMDTHNSASTVTPQYTELVHDHDQQSVDNLGTGDKGGNKSWQDQPTLNAGIRRSIGFESFSSMAKSEKLDAETDKPEDKRDGIKPPPHGDARKLIETEKKVTNSKGEQNEKDYRQFDNNVQSPTRFKRSSLNGQLSKEFPFNTDPDFMKGILQRTTLPNQVISDVTGKHKVNCMESERSSTRKVNYMESESTSTNMNTVSGSVNTIEFGIEQVACNTAHIPNKDSPQPIQGDQLKPLPNLTGFTGFSSASRKSMKFSEKKLCKAKQLFISIDCDTGITDESSLQLADVHNVLKDKNMAEIKELGNNYEMKLPRRTCTSSHAVLSNWNKTTSAASTTKSDIIHSHFKTAPAFAKYCEANLEDMLEKVLEVRNSSGPAVFENTYGRTKDFQSVRDERLGSKHASFEKAMSVMENSTVDNLDVISMSTDPVSSKTEDYSDKLGNREGSVATTETNAVFKGFTTASGKCLKLSDTSLKKASALLDDVNTNFTLTSGPLQEIVEKSQESTKSSYDKARNNTAIKDNVTVSSIRQIPVEIPTQQIVNEDKVHQPLGKMPIGKSCSNVGRSELEIGLPTEVVVDEVTMKVKVPRKILGLSSATRKSLQMRNSYLGNSTKSLDTKINDEQNNNFDIGGVEKRLGNHSNVEKATFSEDGQMDVDITDDTASGTKRKLGNPALMEPTPHVGDFSEDELESKSSQTQDGIFNDLSKSADIGSTSEFGGFSTARGKKLKDSDLSLKKAISLVADVDAGDLSTVGGPRNSITETSADNKSAVCSSTGELGGFSTAAGRKLEVCDKSMKTAMSLIVDVDSGATDIPNREGHSEYKTRLSGKNPTGLNMNDFRIASGLDGFSTAGGKKLKLSENSMRKAMSIISEAADTEDISMHDGFKKSSSLATEGFQTATGRHLQINEASLCKGMSVFRDVDAEVTKELVLFDKDVTDILNVPRKSESTSSKEKYVKTNAGKRTSSRFPPGAVVPKGFRPFKPPKITKKPEVEKTNDKPCVNIKDELRDGKQGVNSMQSALASGKDIPAVSESNIDEPSKTFSDTFDRTIGDIHEISKGENSATIEDNHRDKMSMLKEEKHDQDIEPFVMDELFSEEFESSQRFSPGSGKVLRSQKGIATPRKQGKEADVLPSDEYEEFLDIEDIVLCEATEIKCEPPSQTENLDSKMIEAISERNKEETFLKEVTLSFDQCNKYVVSKTLTSGQASGFSGFQCTSGKNIRISDEAVRKSKQNFEDLSSELEQNSEKMDELIEQELKEYSEIKMEECSEQQASYSGLQTVSGMIDFSSDSVVSKNKQRSDLFGNKMMMEADMGKVVNSNNVTEDEIEMPAESLKTTVNIKPCHNSTDHLRLEYGGFKSASGKKVKVSEEAMTKATQSISDWCSETTDNKNTTAKDRPNKEVVPEFGGFQRASGKKVSVSDEALAEARQRIIDRDSDVVKEPLHDKTETVQAEIQKQESISEFTGFQSTSGKNVSVSEKALAKARQNISDWNSEITESKTEVKTKTIIKDSTNQEKDSEFPGFQSASGKKVSISNQALEKARENISKWNSDLPVVTEPLQEKTEHLERLCPDEESLPEVAGFQTASGKKVSVSNTALAKAKQNLSDWSSELNLDQSDLPESSSFRDDDIDSKGDKSCVISNNRDICDGIGFSGDNKEVKEEDWLVPKCKLVGASENIEKSESVKMAKEDKTEQESTGLCLQNDHYSLQEVMNSQYDFSQDESDMNVEHMVIQCTSDSPNAIRKKVNDTENSTEQTSKVLDDVKNSPFQGASGKKVSISEIAMEQARKVFDDVGNSPFQSASGKKVSISEIAMEQARKVFDDVGNSPFQSASGKKVNVSENAIEQARKVLDDARNSPFQNASGKKVSISENAMEQARKVFDVVGNSPFQSASGKKVIISENAMEQARKVLDDVGNSPFQSASGNKVTISKNSIEQTRKVFDAVGNSPFQSASGNKVNISQNVLEHAKQTLAMAEVSGSQFHSASDEKVDITESALQHARKSMENTDTSLKNVSKTLTGHTPSGVHRGFETNIKGSSLSFNSPFQTATGSKICISESSLQHVRKATSSLESSTLLDNRKSSTSGPEHIKLDKGPRLTYQIRKEVSTIQDNNQSRHPVEENFVMPVKHGGGLTTPRTCQQITGFSSCGLSDTDRPVLIEGMNHSLDEFCQPDDFLEEMEVTPKRRKVEEEEAVTKRSGMVKPMKCVPEAFTRDRQDTSCSLCARVSSSTPIQASRSSLPTQSSITSSQAPAKSSFLTPYKKPDASKSDSITTPQTCAADSATKKPTPKFIPKCLSAPQSDVVKSKTPRSTLIIQKNENQSGNRQGTKKEDDKLVKLNMVELLKEARKHQDEILKAKEKNKISPDPGRLYMTKKGSNRQRMRDMIKLQTRYVGRSRYQHSQLHVGSVGAATAVHHKFYLPDFYTNLQGHVYVGDGAYLVPDDKLYAGKEELFRAFSTLAGVDCRLISDAWFYNHYKWLVWKLAAYEVTSPHNFAGRALTPEVVMLQMKYRYDREIDNCQRSALKKIMERDDTASKRMVLCVCGIHQQSQPGQSDVASNSTNKGDKQADRNEKQTSATSKEISSTDKLDSQVCVELTDGWYSIAAKLDVPLSDHVVKHRIRVGDKLCLSGAELQGPQDACTPLEAPPFLMLKLCANSTRPAPWDAKLGYQSDPRPLCIPLSGLYGEGGNVGCIDVVLARKYPQMYMEKLSEGGSVFRTSLAENKYQHQYQRHRQDEMEKLYAKLQSEFEREDTEEKCISKKKWTKREVEHLQTGHEIYEAYSTSRQPYMIEEYLSDRQRELLIERRRQVQDEKRQKLHEEFQKTWQTTSERTVIPLVKMRFVGCSRKDMDSKASTTVTVWRPTQDVIELKEGTRYKIFGLNASSSRSKYKQCDVQLTATRQTRFMPVSIDENLLDMVYEPREVLSVRDIKCRQPMYGEADFVGMVISVSTMDFAESGRHQEVVYAVDVHGSILGIKFWGGLKSFSLDDVLCEGRVFCASNLMDKSLYRSSVLPLLEASLECSTITQTSQYPTQRRALEKIKSVVTNTHGFLERAKGQLLDLQMQKKDNTRKLTPEKNLKQDTDPLDSVLNTPIEGKLSTSTSTPSVEEESAASRTSKQGQAAYQARMARLLNFGSPAPLSPLATNISRTVKKEFKPPSLRRKSLGPNH
ncbi:breast cancer type 2 susceptibility protein homolog [Argopecten irradians]|uniref:breast cancer type 2 susceptibility protein homolog n=1 Tax=Argopecten irradians TaxID=31199 RepID=UPI0037233B50